MRLSRPRKTRLRTIRRIYHPYDSIDVRVQHLWYERNMLDRKEFLATFRSRLAMA